MRAFLRARLEPMWAGPAGRFLEGGHPADMAAEQMGAAATGSEPCWLEVVLSWPDRMPRPVWDCRLPGAATG